MVNFPCRNVSGGWMIMLMLILTWISVDNVKKLQEKMKYTEASFSFAGLFSPTAFHGHLDLNWTYTSYTWEMHKIQFFLHVIYFMPNCSLQSSTWRSFEIPVMHAAAIQLTFLPLHRKNFTHIYNKPSKSMMTLRHKIWDCSVPDREKYVSWLN